MEMNKDIVFEGVHTLKRGKDSDHNCYWGELVFLYEDETWERIFEYRAESIEELQFMDTECLKGLSREKALDRVEKEYNNRKIHGMFIVY